MKAKLLVPAFVTPNGYHVGAAGPVQITDPPNHSFHQFIIDLSEPAPSIHAPYDVDRGRVWWIPKNWDFCT